MQGQMINETEFDILETTIPKNYPLYDHENVLLLALSTFPNTNLLKESVFEYTINGKKKRYKGVYQLDPVPKMLSDILGERQEYLDKIVMLCTGKTLDDKEEVTIKYLDQSEEKQTCTARTFFEEQVGIYLNPNLENKHQFIEVRISRENGKDNIEKAIYDTITELRGIENLRLYMDTHGGFREVSLVAEAVISLLKIDDIDTPKIYGVKYGASDGTNEIIDGSNGFQMFDFVSGINEFINYGRADSLERFLYSHTHADIDQKQKEKQNDLLKYIKEIAEGIQLCDIPKFEIGLDHLSAFFGKKEEVIIEKEEDISYLSLFIDNIKKDYGKELLSSKRKAIDEIKWCNKKGFYQQLLTLIEGKISKDLYDNWIMYYNAELASKANVDSEGKYEESNYIFNHSIPILYGTEDDKIKILRGEEIKFTRKKEQIIECLKNGVDTTLSTKEINYGCVRFNVSNYDSLYEFLKLHIGLKALRNHSNHASILEVGVTLEQVQNAIELYIEHYQKLIPEQDSEILKEQLKVEAEEIREKLKIKKNNEDIKKILNKILSGFAKNLDYEIDSDSSEICKEIGILDSIEELRKELKCLQKQGDLSEKDPSYKNWKKQSPLVIQVLNQWISSNPLKPNDDLYVEYTKRKKRKEGYIRILNWMTHGGQNKVVSILQDDGGPGK